MRVWHLTPQSTLYESRGFVARRPGDEYVDPNDRTDTATFQGLTLLPSDEKQYATYEEFADAYQDWHEQATGKIYELNDVNRGIKSAYIVNMETPRGVEHYVLFTRDLVKLEGKLTNIPPGVIPGHGGYVMNRKISFSERSGLKPAEVVKGKNRVQPNQVAGLLDVARKTAGDQAVDQMQEYLNALAAGNGTGYVIKDGAADANLHNKYLGEWASPIALITGQFDPKDQLPEIEEVMNGGKSLAGSSIEYNTSTSETLFDSMVVTSTSEIMISTKARTGGAAASVKGLYDALTKNRDKFPAEFWKDPKVEKFNKVVNTIMQQRSIDGLLAVAQLENIVNAAEAQAIASSIDSSKRDYVPDEKMIDYMSSYAANTHHPQYDPAKHALAAVARQVVNNLNDEDYTDVIRQILNHANMVQMYFKTKVRGADLVCEGFDLVWPPQFKGTIAFYSGKFFSATEIKGRLGFKIGQGAKMTDEPDASLTTKVDPAITKKIAKAAERKQQQAVGRIVDPDERDARDPRIPDTVALGRAKKQ